jgi:predicted deacetylase
VRRLRELSEEGSQILLHGLYHESEPVSVARSASQSRQLRLGRWLRQNLASAGEAEFGELSLEQAASRLDQGLSMFAELGLPVHGFVPPAWILPRRLLPALAARKIRYTEDHFGVLDPVSGRRRASAVMNFATRTRLRLFTSVTYVRAARALRHALPLRIAIHPPDLRSPLALRETVRLLDWAAGDFVHSVEELLELP